jgi:hypothetical protein
MRKKVGWTLWHGLLPQERIIFPRRSCSRKPEVAGGKPMDMVWRWSIFVLYLVLYIIYIYTYLYIHMISIISDHLSCQGSTLGSLGLISFNHPLRWLRERQRHLRASGDGAAAAAAFGCPKKGWVYWRSFTTPQLGVCYANFDMEKTRKKLGYTWIYKLPVCSLGRFKPDQNEANRCQWQSSQKDWVVNISTQGQPFEALQRRQPA